MTVKTAKNGTLTTNRIAEHTTASAPLAITIPAMNIKTMHIRLVGDSALICHKWADKAKKMMIDKQTKKAATAKEAKNPNQDFEDSLYYMPDGKTYGFPSVAFKSAAVDACSHVDGITKVEARGAFHIVGDMVEIEGIPAKREDMVRIGMGTADIRYRGEFKKWSCTLTVRFNERVLSAEQIVNLFNMAGFGIGVGEWRPQRDGSFGMFHVATDKD